MAWIIDATKAGTWLAEHLWHKHRRPKAPPKPHHRILLLVEDNPEDAFLARETLRSAGHYCDWVESGEHALERMLHKDYRLVIIDVGLPGINGFRLLKEVRKKHPSMPVLIYTGVLDNLFGLEEGVPVMILIKSINLDALRKAVDMMAA